MIELINVSKYYPTDFGRHYVFRDVSLALPIDKSVGVLGPNGAGKSTFLRLIGGADIPSEGTILRTGRISPPMGLTPGLQSSLTGSENARFAGRICGLPREEINDIIDYVRELANIGKYFEMPVGTYSAGMKQRVAFAINMSMNFDYYLFDEIGAGGDKEFRKVTKAMVQERLATSKFIIASHRTDELLDICDSGIVIQNGELTYYDDIREALAAYGEDDEKADRRARRARRRGVEPDEAAGDTAETAQSESATGESGPDLPSRRKQRGARRERENGEDTPAEEPVASAAGDDERKARHEQRRLKREMKRQDAEAPPEPEPEPVAAEPVAEDNERKARREQRRLKREMKTQDAEAPPEPEPEPVAAEPVAEDDERKARREQRRLKREMKTQDAAPDAEAPPEPEPEPATAEPVAVENDERKARREQRRLKREMKKQESAPAAETVSSIDPVNSLPEVPPEPLNAAARQPSPAGTTPQRKAAPPVGTAPMAQRHKPRPAPGPEACQQQVASAPLPEPLNSTVPGHMRGLPPQPFSSRALMIQRALLRQERSQASAARAARLLLQHLDDTAKTGHTASQSRGWLAAAAQETAALDATQARQMLDGIVSGEAAALPVSTVSRSAAAPLSATGAAAPGPRRTLANHDL